LDLQELVVRLDDSKKPAIQLVPRTKSPGNSKIGGIPNFPVGIDWPRWKDLPMSFLTQIDLSEVPHISSLPNLPTSGILFFFYDQEQSTWGFDPADAGSWQVIFSPTNPSEVREPAGILTRFKEKQVTFRQIEVWPEAETVEPAYFELPDEAFDQLLERQLEPYGGEWTHQMGGYPLVIQNDAMELECQLASNGLSCGDG
jgi:uncharacterized protein YwqG